MTLHVGTSGWAYPEWKPSFYPPKLPQTRFLEHYGTVFETVEVNTSFYGVPTEETIRKWVSLVPDRFLFSMKAHRMITNGKEVAPNEMRTRYLREFLAATEHLGGKRGPLLFQFPPHRERDDAGIEALMGAVPNGLRCAFEFRHDSWGGIEEMIAAAGATVCVASSGGDPPETLPPGSFAYIRLRGDSYTREQRAGWARLLTSDEREVFVFAKHEGVPPEDERAGIGFALRLARAGADA